MKSQFSASEEIVGTRVLRVVENIDFQLHFFRSGKSVNVIFEIYASPGSNIWEIYSVLLICLDISFAT